MTRRELLLAGRRLFSEKGLYESRVEDLTSSAGIAKGTLYQYYRNKEELVQAVVSDGFAELQRHVAARADGARTFLGLVTSIGEAQIGFFAENPDLTTIFNQVRGVLRAERGSLQPLRGSLKAHIDWLSRLLESAPAARHLTPGKCRELASLLFGGISGVTSLGDGAGWSASPRPLPRTVLETFVAAAAGAYAPSGGGRRTPSRSPRRQKVPDRSTGLAESRFVGVCGQGGPRRERG
jgi:AcrR family transcriptional regulator